MGASVDRDWRNGMASQKGVQAGGERLLQRGSYHEREMIGLRQVLLELICYASDRGKPAVLEVRPEKIIELRKRGLIEKRADGYWITELGRGQCPGHCQRNEAVARSGQSSAVSSLTLRRRLPEPKPPRRALEESDSSPISAGAARAGRDAERHLVPTEIVVPEPPT